MKGNIGAVFGAAVRSALSVGVGRSPALADAQWGIIGYGFCHGGSCGRVRVPK